MSEEQLQQDNTEASATETTSNDAVENQQTTETQTQESSPLKADVQKESPLTEANDSKPIKYEAFKIPEGMTMSDEETKAFEDQVRTLGLDQDRAQQALDWHHKQIMDHFQKIADDAEAEQDANLKKWESDPNHNELTLKAQKAANRFFPEMIEKFEVFGLAYDPVFLGALAKIGDLLGEGKMIEVGASSEPKKQSPWDTTYSATKEVLAKQGIAYKD